MNPEKWQEVRRLYEIAVGMRADERRSFLDEECAGDDELREEVESLITADESSTGFLETPAVGAVAAEIAAKRSRVGEHFLHYEIIGTIGAGGMGEVYLAEDKHLNRRVALKFLTDEMTRDEKFLRRFEREARAASGLNHPNIITVHELGKTGDTHFIVTEFVEGVSLRALLTDSRPELDQAVEIALQIVAALQAAHGAGIIHRDMKPDNIMIRTDGIVKVLDFGLAKHADPNGPDALISGENARTLIAGVSDQPRDATNLTAPGLILGTPRYMSPEQARGGETDARSDIFSFGVILYEMIAGEVPFDGETAMDTLGAILHKEPKPLGSEIVPEARTIVEKCLKKDREERFQDASALYRELASLKEDLDFRRKLEKSTAPDAPHKVTEVFAAPTDQTTSGGSNKRGFLRFGIVTAVLAILIAGGIFAFRGFSGSRQIESLAVMPFANESGNAEFEYLSDGMTDALIRSLSQLPNLDVKARSSVFRYKGKNPDVRQVASELDAQAVLIGRFQQKGDQINLYLELIDPATQSIIWSETYDRRQRDIANLQNEIARDVSQRLRLRLSGADETLLANGGTTNPEAYQSYLKGRYHLAKATRESQEQALKHFQESVALDPSFALGYSGIADASTLLSTIVQASRSPEEMMPLARSAAEKALSLNPNLSEAYVSLAWIGFRFDWDWEGAERNFRKAIELNPRNAQAHQWYGEFLSCLRRDDEAVASLNQARKIEPFSTLMQWNYAQTLLNIGRYEEAILEAKKVVEMDRDFQRTYRVLRTASQRLGRDKDAMAYYIDERRYAGDSAEKLEKYQRIFEREGFLAALRDSVNDQFIAAPDMPATQRTILYNSINDRENTLRSIEYAFSKRMTGVLSLRFAHYDPLRNEPRFQEIYRKINFPK